MCALGRAPGELLALQKFRTEAPEPTITRIAEFFAGHEVPAAVGVGAFGPIELDPGSSSWGTLGATPKPGWAHAPLGPALRDRLGVPVVLETDVNAAAIGEQRWGAGRGADSVCYVTVGTGIGAGLVVNGAPVHGLSHPEAGHLRVPHDRARDPFDGSCPFHGDCWEGLAAGGALRARWGIEPAQLPDEHPAWELEAEYLALGILAIVLVASPQRVIVGGGVMQRRGLRERVTARLRELLGGYVAPLAQSLDAYLTAPQLGDDAGVLGAIALVAPAEHA